MFLATSAAAAAMLPERIPAQEYSQAQFGTEGPHTPTTSDKEIRCGHLDSAHEVLVSSADELLCLKQLGDIASRQGNQLRLKLASGKAKTYASGSKACEDHIVGRCTIYRLAGFFSVHQMTLVYAALYEGSSWLLMSRRTGNQIKLLGPPHFFPERKQTCVDEVG